MYIYIYMYYPELEKMKTSKTDIYIFQKLFVSSLFHKNLQNSKMFWENQSYLLLITRSF